MAEYVIASDWPFGVEAVLKGKELLEKGHSALGAVEEAIRIVEDNPSVNSVGTGGLPNAEGVLELDACIMDGTILKAGGVACIQMTKNPISVARKVMELTPHVLLVGQGATDFARRVGFPQYDPLTPKARETWKRIRDEIFSSKTLDSAEKRFRKFTGYGGSNVKLLAEALRSLHRIPHGGTVGVVATDKHKHIAGGTSTSGWAMRFPGRVSDSAIIGAGTYSNRTAAASATGIGETAIRHCLTKSVCDLVEEGLSPTKACEVALLKMLSRERFDHLVAVICVDVDCNVGGASTQPGFQFEYMKAEDTEPIVVHPKPVDRKSKS